MTDRELLELAAKAAGYERNGAGPIGPCEWNPLNDDGHALRLAVRLGILLRTDFIKQLAELMRQGMDHCAATRRAIVRTAAEIGRTKSTPTTPTGDE